MTSAEAWPTAVSVQAMAMTRTVPEKSGMSKVMVALPSASTSTMPEWSATSTEVGGGVPVRDEPPSPPERMAPARPWVGSISEP